MDLIDAFLGRNGYLPHGYCFSWMPALLWSIVIADAGIALAYFSIPLAIVSYVRRRKAASHRVAWLFCAFIFACGTTHVMDVWTVWRPDYGVQAITKVVTALVSVATAIALWPLITKALKLPSVDQLQAVISQLEAEVTRRVSAEDYARSVEQSLAMSLAGAGAGFMVTDRAGLVTRMNSVAERVTGWNEHEAQGRSLWEILVRDGHPAGQAAGDPLAVLREHGWTPDTVHAMDAIARDGTRTPLDVRGTVAYDDQGRATGIALVFNDTTRLRRAEHETNQLAVLVESSNDAIIGETHGGQITTWNRAAEHLFGFTAAEAIGSSIRILIPPEREPEDVRIRATIAAGGAVPLFETVRRTKSGALVDVSVSASPILDMSGRVIGASKIIHDATHLRRAEAALRESRELVEIERAKKQRVLEDALAEKEVLLREIHHRVKNNLQVISSLLQLQARRVTSEETLPLFADSEGRIRSMALVHEKLYRSDDLAHIDFCDYVHDLVAGVAVSNSGSASHVDIEVLCMPMQVGIDRAIPCGLVINELVANSLKHAFPHERAGRITVEVGQADAATMVISVSDDGIGWPATFDPAESSTLGLRLVRILARQLHGTVTMTGDDGVTTVMRIEAPR